MIVSLEASGGIQYTIYRQYQGCQSGLGIHPPFLRMAATTLFKPQTLPFSLSSRFFSRFFVSLVLSLSPIARHDTCVTYGFNITYIILFITHFYL